jgi:hypothetical protein
MADDFREQVNRARRAGYSDDEIIGYLKQSDTRVSTAIKEGFTPQEILGQMAPPATKTETALRQVGIAAKGAGPVALGTAVGGLLGGPPGALVGSLAVPAADALVSAYRGLTGQQGQLPSEAIRDLIPGPRAETRMERMVQAGGEALGGAAGQVQAGRAAAQAPGFIGAAGKEISRAPIAQLITAPVAGATSTGVAEATGSPLAGLAAGVATTTPFGLSKVKREQAPTAEQLLQQSRQNYQTLEQSGLQFDTGKFTGKMSQVGADLRKEGYTPTGYPKITGALSELTSTTQPKDVTEIQALRSIVKNAQNSSDRSEARLASLLLDDFDDYVLNAPPSDLVGGNRQAVEAWKTARADYTKMKKGEIFDEIVRKAQLSTTDKQQAIASSLSTLAKNDKKMRFFTPEERKSIEAAAKGDNAQAMLRVVSKFTPMTPAAAIFTAVAGPAGAGLAAAGLTAKSAGAARSEAMANRLAEQMRLGRLPMVIEPFSADVPIMFSRGVMSGQSALTQPVNALAP